MIRVRAAAAVVLSLTAALQPAQVAPVALPFELVNRHIVLPVSVNGGAPLSFIFDTGDRVAILDLDRAKRMGVTLGQEVRVGGVGSARAAGNFLSGATYTVPGLPGFSQPVVVALPLTRLATRLGHDFDGILGADFIKEFVVEIDYAAGVLRLHDRGAFTYQGRGEVVPIRFNASGHPLVEATVTPLGGGPIPGTFVVDVGSGATLALYSPFVAEHRLPGPGVKTIKAMGLAGAGGEGSGRIGRVASLTIGRVTLARPTTVFSEDTSGAFADRTLAGNIGYEILRRFRIFLDYGRSRMVLEPTDAVDAPFDRPATGFTFETAPDDYHVFKVTGVLEQSPAAEADVKPGDEIAAIDGRPAAQLTLTSIANLFEQPVERTLVLRRGTGTVTVRLTPRVLVE